MSEDFTIFDYVRGSMYRISISQIAPPAVCSLIVILAYGSQVFLRFIEPYHLERQQTIIFNTLVSCIWITYAQACLTDPGRIPKDWLSDDVDVSSIPVKKDSQASPRYRWCRNCEAFKPPRAHHCKTCQRYCIVDHQCLLSSLL
jgi:palmitoyltransferase